MAEEITPDDIYEKLVRLKDAFSRYFIRYYATSFSVNFMRGALLSAGSECIHLMYIKNYEEANKLMKWVESELKDCMVGCEVSTLEFIPTVEEFIDSFEILFDECGDRFLLCKEVKKTRDNLHIIKKDLEKIKSMTKKVVDTFDKSIIAIREGRRKEWSEAYNECIQITRHMGGLFSDMSRRRDIIIRTNSDILSKLLTDVIFYKKERGIL